MSKFYVTKEIAEKLRGKGYPIISSYELKREMPPRIDEVLAWLREKHLFHVKIGCFYPNRWHYYIQTVMDTYYYDNCRDSFDSYEEAAIAGIEDVIDNLI
jgi:hypothetical protein